MSLSQILNQKLQELNASPLILVITLTPVEINLLTYILSRSPEYVDAIADEVNKIVRQGRIELHDIPDIILLIVDIYKTKFSEHDINIADIAGIVKFTVDALLHSGVLPLPEIEIEIIEKLLDSSIALLKTSPRVVSSMETCCFKLF
jgi:hypothetical protein